MELVSPPDVLRSGRQRRHYGALQHASSIQAARKAQSWSSSPFFSNATPAQLQDLFLHTQAVAEFGAAASTLTKDQLAWRHWQAYADTLGFDPHLRPEDTLARPHEVASLLPGYLLYIYPRMRGKRGRRWAKPGSAWQYVLALLRCFQCWEVPMPPARVARQKLRGLLRSL